MFQRGRLVQEGIAFVQQSDDADAFHVWRAWQD
jgi:hypothetical protein